MDPKPARIRRVVIEELFGPESPPIDIPLRLDERVTVLHGRNGSGKTWVLKLLAAVRDEQFDVLRQVPFKRLTIQRIDGSAIAFERNQRLHWDTDDVSFSIIPGSSRAKRKIVRGPLSQFIRYPVFRTFHQELPPIKLVQVDRLASPTDEGLQGLTVDRLADDIRNDVYEADLAYRKISTQRDSTLTQRLVAPAASTIPLDELRARYSEWQRQEARLRDLGLMRETSAPLSDDVFSEKNQHLLAVIVTDSEQKLEPFRRLADRAQRLLDTLNRKLAPKSIRLDVETGYHVTTASGQPLPLGRLSSGEQHELVLLHELLFDTPPGTLILIDEPELSLHVTWQQEFLSDLLAVAQLSDLDFILATHSPYIVGDHPELMVRLGEPIDVDA